MGVLTTCLTKRWCHAASASGSPVPSRTVALSPETAVESWALGSGQGRRRSAGVDREPDARQTPRYRTLMGLVHCRGALPSRQLRTYFDIGI